MKFHGTVIEFDPKGPTGVIKDSENRSHLIQNGSFRRTVKLQLGDAVRFNSFNLFAGAVAMDIEQFRPRSLS